MPLIAHCPLPTFERLHQEGELVLSTERAHAQSIRELHIGLLNMMPDAALQATERQFFRLISHSNQIAQFYLHPFTIPSIVRDAKGQAHVEQYYQSFDTIKQQGLDALIITGANVTDPDLEKAPFWSELKIALDWAYQNVTSTLCSCLATHAVLAFRYGQRRQPIGKKCWGVFNHQVVNRHHPLVTGMNTRFDVPHSRFNEITKEQFIKAGLTVLVESDVGVHLAVSEDLLRLVFFQGHPEYDLISLLKEYKREVARYLAGDRNDYPPFPENYLHLQGKAILNEFQQQLADKTALINDFPEKMLMQSLDNTWHDSTIRIINNWLGLVYQTTHIDVKKPFMDDVDPSDPLKLKHKLS